MLLGGGLIGLLLFVLGLILYFLPTFVALQRRHHNRMAIAALNLLLGWTFIGWAAAMVWSLMQVKTPGST